MAGSGPRRAEMSQMRQSVCLAAPGPGVSLSGDAVWCGPRWRCDVEAMASGKVCWRAKSMLGRCVGLTTATPTTLEFHVGDVVMHVALLASVSCPC